MKFELKKKIFFSLIIFGIISVLLIFLMIYPLLKEIKKDSEDFISQKEKLISLKEEIKNFKKIESLYKTYQPNLDKIESLFINPEFPVEFISFLEENAEKSQLKIEISPLAGKKETEPWPSLFFKIKTSSSFTNFLKFLERLESSFYLIEISDLNIKRLAEKEIRTEEFKTGDIDANFSIIIYTK